MRTIPRLLLLVACSALAGFAEQAAAQAELAKTKITSTDEAVALIESLGGFAARDPEQPGQPIVSIDFRRPVALASEAGITPKTKGFRPVAMVSDADLAQLAKLQLPELAFLSLYGVPVTDAGLVHLSKFPKLEYLQISSAAVTDAGLVHLSKIPKLKYLGVHGPTLTDRGFAEVAKAGSLVTLGFTPNLTDKGLVHCDKLTKLETLNLSGNKLITDAGLVHLKGLDSLTTLNLSGNKLITDAGLVHLKELDSLTTLNLSGNKLITDAGLEQLKGLDSLTTLDLSRTSITDAGLKHLAALPKLQSLMLNVTKVTDAGLVHLVGLKLFELHLGHTAVTVAGLERHKLMAIPRLGHSPIPVDYREPTLEPPSSKQAERWAEVVSWLPPDTETVLVARGPFAVGNEKAAASQSVAAFLELRLAWPSLMSLQERKYASDLQGTRVGLAVEGGRRFQPPTDIGARRYEGCRIFLFEEDFVTKGDRLFEKIFRDASATEEIASHKVALFKEPAEHMTLFVARPAPNIMIEATDRAYLEEVLKRRQQKDLARAGLLDSPAWKKLDPGARYWLVRTYAKSPGDDITSPYLEGSRTADSKAKALAFAFPKAAAKSPVMFYFSDHENAARIAKKSWGEPAIVEPVEPGVTSIRFPIAVVQDLDEFVMWLSWHFGYHEYP